MINVRRKRGTQRRRSCLCQDDGIVLDFRCKFLLSPKADDNQSKKKNGHIFSSLALALAWESWRCQTRYSAQQGWMAGIGNKE